MPRSADNDTIRQFNVLMARLAREVDELTGNRRPPEGGTPRERQAQAETAGRAAVRAAVRRSAPVGQIAMPLVNMATDPNRRERFGRDVGNAARTVAGAAGDAWDYVSAGQAARDASGALRAAPRVAQQAAAEAPQAIARTAQAAPGALRGALGAIDRGARWVADQAPGERPDLAAGVGALALRHGPGIVRAVTYGPFEDEERAQQELDYARAMGDDEAAQAAAGEANLQTGFGALNVLGALPAGAGARAAGRLGRGREAVQAVGPSDVARMERGVERLGALRAESLPMDEASRMGRAPELSAPRDVRHPVEVGLLTREQFNLYNDLSYHDDFAVVEVPVASLVRQHGIDPARRTGSWYQGRGGGTGIGHDSALPVVARVDGRLVVMDGHHRLASEAGPIVRVRIADVDRYTNPPQGFEAVRGAERGKWSLQPRDPPAAGKAICWPA